MNDDNISACIAYAKHERLYCADDAADEYAALLVKLQKAKHCWDRGSPNFETNVVEFPFDVATEIDTFFASLKVQP